MNQLNDIANRHFDLISKPVRLAGYTHGKGVEDVYCLVKEVLGSRHFKVPVSDIYIDEQSALPLFGGHYV